MTACFKLVRAFHQHARSTNNTHCRPCVYYSKNLDPADYPVLMQPTERCGLGFLPGDEGCSEMRTDNCSPRKR